MKLYCSWEGPAEKSKGKIDGARSEIKWNKIVSKEQRGGIVPKLVGRLLVQV